MLNAMGKAARQASYQLSTLSTAEKNRALLVIADMLEANSQSIIQANELDMATARASGMTDALLDRLLLTPARLSAIASDVRDVCRLSDPVGQVIDGSTQDSGLKLERRRVPLGVVGVIYEARPNVTIDVASLCLKTGNAVILRGGKETHHTNQATVKVIQQALEECVDFDKALTVIESAKVQRPSACNSLETVLVHQAIAARFLPELSARMHRAGVTLHASESAMPHLQSGPANVLAVTEEDYQDEWLSLDLNVTVVAGLDAAVAHIRTYGTEHSDAILTRSISSADRFVREVDSSAVYVN